MAIRLDHSGNAAPTTLTANINATDTVLNMADSSGWPLGSVGPFVVTLDRGTDLEERILVNSRSGTTLTVRIRGWDGTTALSHSAPGCTVEHTSSATEADEANVAAVAVEGATGGLVGVTQAQTLTNKTLSTGTVGASVDVTAVLSKVYPVGSVYIATVATNPGTLFGFGTWAAYGEGRVLVGKAPSGTFATAAATGGEETHTLTSAEMPAHTHAAASDSFATATGATDSLGSGGAGRFLVSGAAANTGSTGGGGAHNNLQPYVVTYMWQRTA